MNECPFISEIAFSSFTITNFFQHRKGAQGICPSSNIIRVFKSRKMKLFGLVARIG
jgi:hypothetical protein